MQSVQIYSKVDQMFDRFHLVLASVYRKSGYLCGNIIYANYASSCEGA